jgi:hypothetical protein
MTQMGSDPTFSPPTVESYLIFFSHRRGMLPVMLVFLSFALYFIGNVN